MNYGTTLFQYRYQINPITLYGGIAENMPQGFPLLNMLQGADFPTGVLSQPLAISFNDYFANFVVMPGGTFIEQEVGTYPFANAAVAANATIAQPLRFSLRMICPARTQSRYSTKAAILQNLKTQLELHNSSGGYYGVATPSIVYPNALLLKVSDLGSVSKQPQIEWQWDFYQPLLTEQQAQVSLNNAMGKIHKQTMWTQNPAWSGIDPTQGVPDSLAAIGLVPSASSGPSIGFTAPTNPVGAP